MKTLNKKFNKPLLALAIMLFCLSFAFSFDNTGVVWFWQTQMLAAGIFMGISLMIFLFTWIKSNRNPDRD